MAGASAFSPRGIPRPVVRELRKTVPISRACTQSLIETCPVARPMGRDFYTLDDFDLSGSTVLLRVDINSPIDPSTGRLLNDRRIREHLATIRDLRHTRVAILAHQSLPGHPVRYVDSLFGQHAIQAIQEMKVGDVILLDNTRFFAEEETLADAKFEKMGKAMMVRKLAPLAQYFVLDAFAAAHRA